MSVKVQKNAKEQTEESTTVVNRSLLTIDYASERGNFFSLKLLIIE